MSAHERFLSVRLNPARSQEDEPLALVLECDEEAGWWLYYLNSEDKISGAKSFRTLEEAQSHAKTQFHIEPYDWIKDHTH